MSKTNTEVITRGGVILENSKQQVLLVKGRAQQKWGAPKGSIEEGETPDKAARREFHEETGIKLTDAERLVHTMNIYDVHYLFYKTDRDISLQNIVIDEDEIIEVAWVDKCNLPNMTHAMNRSLRVYTKHYLYRNWEKKKHVKRPIIDDDGWTTVV